MSVVSFTPKDLALRWLYVDFNSYFASVEQQLNPALRGRPVAIVPVETDATSAIAASYEAKAFGIKTGTPIWEAKQRCKELICVLARHEHYVEFHHRILVEMENHLPVTRVCSIDEVACQLMSNENSIERVTQIAQSIKQGLARNIGEYVRCSIGVAPNRYLAKIATDIQKPDGFTILEAKDLPHRLHALKLRDLPGVGYNMEQRILRAGIGSVQELMKLSPQEMRKIWGSVWGEKMWHMLRGEEVLEEETERHSIGHSHVLGPELRPQHKARFVARRLVLKAASRLRRMGYYASALGLSVRLEEGGRLATELHCYRAEDSMTFLHMLEMMWMALMRKAGAARIKKVSVVLSGLVEKSSLQPELFDSLSKGEIKRRAKAEKMSQALDKINHRYGRDSVVLGMLPTEGRSFSGTKIAFTRIPDVEEFDE